MREYGSLHPEDNPDSDIDPCSFCDEEYRCNFELDSCIIWEAVKLYIEDNRIVIKESIYSESSDVLVALSATYDQIEEILTGETK